MLEKQEIREEIKKKRGSLSENFLISANKHVKNIFLEQIDLKADDIIAGYSSINNEIDVIPILDSLSERKQKCCLPVAKNKELTFKEYKKGDSLEIAPNFGFKEPNKNKKELIPNIILIPLIAADKKGNRIGYGKGYYDKTLAKLKKHKDIKTYGICYNFQIFDQIPTENHDIKIDELIIALV